MKHISASTDELMWLIAEEGEASAIEAFVKRYPEHRGELLKRVNMVRELKGSRPHQAGVPSFEQRPPKPLTPSTPWRAALLTLPLAGMLFASYWLTASWFGRPNDQAPIVQGGMSEPLAQPNRQPDLGARTPAPDLGTAQETVRPEAPPPPAQRSVTLRSERTTLFEALNWITRTTGLRFELAPDIANQEISVDYDGVPALTALKDMGLTLGFTPFDQGDGTVLVIPAVDPKAQDSPPLVPDGGTRIVDRPAADPDAAGTNVSVPHRP